MMLAQGGFAAFLQATGNERAPVLEQITGTEIYSNLSRHVFERQKNEKELLVYLNHEFVDYAGTNAVKNVALKQSPIKRPVYFDQEDKRFYRHQRHYELIGQGARQEYRQQVHAQYQ